MGYLDNTGLSHFWGKIKAALNLKQDALVSGTNIKTINNTSLLGSGNIDISGGSDVLFVAEYGTTTYAQITAALNANKLLFCYVSWNDIVCPYIGVVNSQYAFSNLGAGESTVSLYVNSSNQWSYATSNLATRSAVNAKQDALVSGTNIKTINNESILGSGNISISAGSSDVFIAEYDTTTWSEVYNAVDAGKPVVATTGVSGETLPLVGTDPDDYFIFSGIASDGGILEFELDDTDDWTRSNGSTLATLVSPTFSGTPKAPTATAGTNTTQIATTAFVTTAINNAIGSALLASY